jgi:hypothetical protein
VCARATAGSRPAPAGAASFNGSLALGGVSALCYKAAAVEAAYREYLLLLECGLKSLPRVDGNLNLSSCDGFTLADREGRKFAGTRQSELLVSQRWLWRTINRITR